MSDPVTDSTEATVETTLETSQSTPRKRSRFGTFLAWMLIVFAIMQLILRTVWEPSWGPAIVNLITYSQILLSVTCILIWWFFFSSFRRGVVLGIGIPVLLAIGVWMASIYDVDSGGDMNLIFRYRWQPRPIEKLAEFRENAKTASTEKIETVDQFSPEDMPAYRGIHRDGVVIGPEIRSDWETNPPTELWRRPIGGGYSSFAVVDPVVVTMEQRGEEESVVCYDIATGNEFWVHRYPAYFTALGGPGPRSTPTIHNNAVYSFGCYGDLFCLDLKSGEPLWHVNVLQQFGLPTTHWGMAASPLIHDGHVIVNIGGLEQTGVSGLQQLSNGLVAYQFDTGKFAWKSAGLPKPDLKLQEFKTGLEAVEGIEGKTLPGYSSPMLAEFSGREVILNFDGAAFRANDPENGTLLWEYPFVAGDYINVAQPLVLPDDRVMISSGYGQGSVLFQVSKDSESWELKELWKSNRLRAKFSSVLAHEGFIYGLDEGIMVCLDAKTGERKWKGRREGLRGRYGHGQMLLTNDHIVVLTEQGDLVLIDPSPEELRVDGIVNVLSEETKTWNPLTIAYGKAFVRNAAEFACFDLRADSSKESSGEQLDEQVTSR